ncbi:hypothetical protein SAMN02910456_01205 [Ruminococcaceae bacterium YRB3002]|nr:hypothetical protein SAMN02910456_01205 [Ruminococcaceae bacterium YRB3002]
MAEEMDKELSLDDLDAVSGGKVYMSGYAALTALIYQMKALGKSKEDCIRAVEHSWATDADFKTKFTDQTDADLQRAIDFVNKAW